MKKCFTEEQIIGLLHGADAGMAVKGLCRRHGLSEGSYYLWRSKFGGMALAFAQRQMDERGSANTLSRANRPMIVGNPGCAPNGQLIA